MADEVPKDVSKEASKEVPREIPKAETGSLVLRDSLAIDRTALANERTLLAYIRTSLGLLVSGLAMIRYLEWDIAIVIGYVFLPASVIFLFVGAYRFIESRVRLEKEREKSETNSQK